MKILIWALGLIIIAIIISAFSMNGVILGGLPMAAIFGGGVFLISTTCNAWDRKKSKQHYENAKQGKPVSPHPDSLSAGKHYGLNELLEITKRKNRENVKFTVNVLKDGVAVPKLCTCCLKETAMTEQVKKFKTEVQDGIRYTRTVSLDFPLCDKCFSHRNEVNKKKWILNAVSMLVGVAITLTIGFNGMLLTLWLLPFLGAIGVYIILGLLVKTAELTNEHSNKVSSVWFSNIDASGSMLTINFTNMFYAKLFADANKLTLGEEEYRKRFAKEGVMRSVSRPKANAVLVCCVVFASFFVLQLQSTGDNGPSVTIPSTGRSSSPSLPRLSNSGADANSSGVHATPGQLEQPVFDEPEVKHPKNGHFQIFTGEDGIAPFSVKTPPGDYYYYVLLNNASTGKTAVSLFVHPGKTVNIDVPLGDYEMYYALGETWYGTTHLFGPDTVRSKADDIFSFHILGDNINGNSIELISRFGGNLSTSPADADAFEGAKGSENLFTGLFTLDGCSMKTLLGWRVMDGVTVDSSGIGVLNLEVFPALSDDLGLHVLGMQNILTDSVEGFEVFEESRFTVGLYKGTRLSGKLMLDGEAFFYYFYITIVNDISYTVQYFVPDKDWRLDEVEMMVATFVVDE